MNVLPVKLPSACDQALRLHATRAYPNECCGVVFGLDLEGRRDVLRLAAVENSFEAGEQYHRFTITPKDLLNAEREAAQRGETVLGFYHSHPDHPAKPSDYDRDHAWPFYSYLIVAVEAGNTTALTSWQLDEASNTFAEQQIVVSG